MDTERVNVTVVTHNRLELTRRCLESLARTRHPFRLTVVDNASRDGTQDHLRELQRQGVIHKLFLLGRNMGVAVAANLGWAETPAAFYCKVDNDILIQDPDWLGRLARTLARNPGLGLLGYRLCPWHSARPETLPSGDTILRSDGCGGGCVCIPDRTRRILGFWCEDYGRYGWEDLDYGVRAAMAGLGFGYRPEDGAVLHLGESDRELRADYQFRKTEEHLRRAEADGAHHLNLFLYASGLRPLRMARKHMPVAEGGRLRFVINPDYRSIMVRQRLLRGRFAEKTGEGGLRISPRPAA